MEPKIVRYSAKPKILVHLALMLVCFIVGFPMIFTLIKSTQSIGQIFAFPQNFMPGSQIVTNYLDAWTNTTPRLELLMGNTLLVAALVMFCKTLLSLLAGMAFVYFRFPLRGPLFVFVLLTLMMPTDILIVALFRLMFQLGWSNTLQALIVPFAASATGTFCFASIF
jgi:sn-glycerol 3-phosphate transport system permease protein